MFAVFLYILIVLLAMLSDMNTYDLVDTDTTQISREKTHRYAI